MSPYSEPLTDGGRSTNGSERGEKWQAEAKSHLGGYFCCECLHNHRYLSQVWEDHIEHALTLPEHVFEALSEAAMDRQTHVGELVGEYVKRGVERDTDRSLHPGTDQGESDR